MQKSRYFLFIVLFACHLALDSPINAFVSIAEVKADKVANWLSRSNIRIRTERSGKSWHFAVMCPPLKTPELQWGISLCLKQNDIEVAQVAVKPRVITDVESKQLAGWLVYEFTFSKDFLEESSIMAYVEQKMPRDPWDQPHIYNSINVKDLLAVGG